MWISERDVISHKTLPQSNPASQQVNKSKLIDRDGVQEVNFVIIRLKEETFLTIYSWLLSERAHWTFALSQWMHSYLILFSHNLLKLNSSEASNPLLDLVMIGKRLKKLWRGVNKWQQERHTAGIHEPSFFTFLNDSSKSFCWRLGYGLYLEPFRT